TIAAFTFTLWIATNKQARLTHDVIELGNKEFIATHRPKIRLRRIRPIIPLKPNEPAEALIEAANIGDTKATIFEIGVDIYFADQPFNARPVPVPITL